MPRNGSGTYSRTNGVNSGPTTWQLDRDAGTKILASRHDTHDQDIADALTFSIAKDGQTTVTANLPMGGFNHTGVGDATARTQYPSMGQMQDNKNSWLGTTGGSSNAFTASLSPAITAYITGMKFSFIADRANTGAATLNINGVGATPIVRSDGSTALSSGDLVLGDVHTVLYDGTSWVLIQAAKLIGNATSATTATTATTATALQTPRAIGIAGSTGLTATGVNFDGTAAINPALTGTLNIANGGTGATSAANAFTALKQDASTTATGVVELATSAEVSTGTDTARVPPVSAMGSHLGMVKAWINFDGTGTPSIRSQYNVASITDNGVGDYTLNFITPLADANYAMVGSASRSGFPQCGTVGPRSGGTYTTSAIRIQVTDDLGSAIDSPIVSVLVIGN